MKIERYLGLIIKVFEWFDKKFENNLILNDSAVFY